MSGARAPFGPRATRGASALLLALLAGGLFGAAGCGSAGEQSDPAQEIESLELAALPPDPNFVGNPLISVECKRFACVATLGSDELRNIPLTPEDRWSIARAEPELIGGSAIVGYVQADARFACLEKYVESNKVTDLKPCAGEIAEEGLP